VGTGYIKGKSKQNVKHCSNEITKGSYMNERSNGKCITIAFQHYSLLIPAFSRERVKITEVCCTLTFLPPRTWG